MLVEGVDPRAQRRAGKLAQRVTLQLIAEEWLDIQANKLAAVTLPKVRWMLTEFILPHLGSRPIHEITASELLQTLRLIEARGRHETAHQTKQYVGQVLRYVIATGRAERDITTDLRGALTAVTSRNHAAVTDPAAIGALLRSIEGYDGQPATHAALKLAPLVFVRPGGLRKAEWSEFNLDAAE